MDKLASKILCSPDNSWQDRTVHQKLAELGMLNRTVCKDYSYNFWDINLCAVFGSKITKVLPRRLQGSTLSQDVPQILNCFQICAMRGLAILRSREGPVASQGFGSVAPRDHGKLYICHGNKVWGWASRSQDWVSNRQTKEFSIKKFQWKKNALVWVELTLVVNTMIAGV